MSIVFDENLDLFCLETANTSYIIGLADHRTFVGHVYYGRRVRRQDLRYLLRTGEAPFVPSGNERECCSFYDTFPAEYSGNGVGDYRESSIAVRTQAGQHAVMPTYVSYEITDQKPQLPGLPSAFDREHTAQTLILRCRDEVLQLDVDLYYTVFEENDMITRSVRISNQSKEAVYLTKAYSACMDMDDDAYEMLTLHGSWARERQMDRRPLGYGKTSVGSIRGESSHQEHPFMAWMKSSTTQTAGEVYAMHFIYSGNFIAQLEKSQFDSIRAVMGIHPADFSWKLESEESFYTPEAVLTFSAEGLGKMTRNFHDFYRNHLIRSKYRNQKRPILINNWEATYFDFNEEKILKIAEQAQKLGIEMLVLDDGWFGKREDDNSGLGDWFVNEKKMNGSMAQLAEKIHRMGMKFGLWFEPEMISEDSDLYRAHPDWAFAIPGRVPNHSRNQLVLDMTREDVREYLLERLTTIVHDAKIDYVKWDMNRSVCDVYSHVAAQNRNGELYHRYVLGVYDLLERFLAACPDLLLEGCSGGGGRYDAGMMYYSPQIWCSDNTDAINRLSIQYGSSFFYPISTVGSHVSVCPNHQTGRVTPFRTRGDVALAGSFGYEMDLNKISEEEKEMVKEQVAAMHEYYELTHEGLYYRLTGLKKQDFMAWEFVAKDQSRALLTIVKTDAEGNMLPVHTKVCGLAEDKLYRCSLDQEVRLGRTWNRAGLTLHQVLEEYESIRVEFTEVK